MVKLLHRGNKPVCRQGREAREAIQGMANFSNYAIKWFRFIIIDFSETILFASGRPADNILLLLAHEQVWEKMTFSTAC